MSKCHIVGNLMSRFKYHLGRNVRKHVFGGFANNTGANQPALPRSLISAFVIRFLESNICKLATDEIAIV